jgi:hypothetical protein
MFNLHWFVINLFSLVLYNKWFNKFIVNFVKHKIINEFGFISGSNGRMADVHLSLRAALTSQQFFFFKIPQLFTAD